MDSNMMILHPSYACSSLILGSFGEISLTGIKDAEAKKDGPKDFNDFVSGLQKSVDNWGEHFKKGYSNHPVEHFAHIVASTSHRQPKTEQYLEEFGFQASERVPNKKNPKEKITFWNMPVYKMLENLKEFKNA